MKNSEGIISYKKLPECRAINKNGKRCSFPVWYRGAKYCFMHFIVREEEENNENAANVDIVVGNDNCNTTNNSTITINE